MIYQVIHIKDKLVVYESEDKQKVYKTFKALNKRQDKYVFKALSTLGSLKTA